MKKVLVHLSMLAILALLMMPLVACGGGEEKPAEPAPAAEATPMATPMATPASTEAPMATGTEAAPMATGTEAAPMATPPAEKK